jgi:PhnB protein
MAAINPYLTFNGNCEEAFTFYKAAFGHEFQYIGRFGEMPPQEGMSPLPESEMNKIMHVSLPISKETILMGSDTNEMHGLVTMGSNVSVSINTESKTEADNLFQKLSAGGHVVMPMEKTFWGAYFGMFTDKFGIHWMVNFDEVQM